ncbi:methyltransferase domain-containing protein [Thalassospiraceae bacterium LMO-SO8]|nr:methyltransferase domain-containing protein [Alphaproteobacteria bacterium LMO-S08]WND76158.1 methyltransferase domain-containing protein [Thalassospiraceae bacterium LMO-SO8]
MSRRSQAVRKAEEYYDSSEADAFYKNVWGGEDIHIGIYNTPDEDIAQASRRTVETMALQIPGLGRKTRVIDLGAGYGGSARHLAGTYGCRVTCLNLSETQNDLNRDKNAETDLDALIDVVHGSFEDIPAEDASVDLVWSQDAILHSGDRPRVLDEISRVLAPGGHVIFTDPMQADDVPDGVLQPILDRIHLTTLGSFAFYRDEFAKRGFSEVRLSPMLNQLRTHYFRVGEDLKRRYDEIVRLSGKTYVDNMLRGLDHWVNGADKGYLAWGILHFKKG